VYRLSIERRLCCKNVLNNILYQKTELEGSPKIKPTKRNIQERVKRIEANNKRPIRKFNESNPFEMLIILLHL
jgi:hypothetical protein